MFLSTDCTNCILHYFLVISLIFKFPKFYFSSLKNPNEILNSTEQQYLIAVAWQNLRVTEYKILTTILGNDSDIWKSSDPNQAALLARGPASYASALQDIVLRKIALTR